MLPHRPAHGAEPLGNAGWDLLHTASDAVVDGLLCPGGDAQGEEDGRRANEMPHCVSSMA